MFIEAVLIGVFIGGFKGGRLSNIINMNFRGWYLILFALLLNLIPLFIQNSFMLSIQSSVLFLSVIIMLAVLLLNLDKKGVWLIALGAIFNIAIMAFNGLDMMILRTSLESAGLFEMIDSISNGNIVNYMISDANNFTKIFTKFIVIKTPYPFAKVLSIGDIIMSLGVMYMIIGEMGRKSSHMTNKVLQYSYKRK